FTRAGFAARGVLYMVIGYLALRSGGAADSNEALDYLRSGAGQFVLALMAIGFLAYGVWRLSEALIDTEGHGTDAKGIAARLGGAISGLTHLALSAVSARLAMGADRGAGSGDGGASEGASMALGLPGGDMLLMAAAAAIIVTGLYQLVKAVKLGFLKHLDPAVAGKPWIAWIGRAGFAARGVVFVIVGWFLWNAALHARAAEAAGTERAMASLPDSLRLLVAAGFVLFGLFSLVEARYRKINDPHVLSRLKRRVPSL
ncbi:MAG: DUF1206 domain-containing protein, partial [Sphingomonadales bacterium]